MADKRFMLEAVKKAEEGLRRCQTPFGACVVRNGRIISSAHNTVWKDLDSTAHAEVNAIRKACKKLRTIDLSDCTIYSTCEPCPMCFSAIYWAKIQRVVYGCSIEDAKKAGFSELALSNKRILKLTKAKMRIKSGFMRKQCIQLFKTFNRLLKEGRCKTY